MTREQALAHPNWSMGAKITVDSATMMNKGLELIEAMWLYDLPPEDIEIVVHREHRALGRGICGRRGHRAARPAGYAPAHSAHALTWPGACRAKVPRMSLAEVAKLTFFAPDYEAFPGAESRKSRPPPSRATAARC